MAYLKRLVLMLDRSGSPTGQISYQSDIGKTIEVPFSMTDALLKAKRRFKVNTKRMKNPGDERKAKQKRKREKKRKVRAKRRLVVVVK